MVSIQAVEKKMRSVFKSPKFNLIAFLLIAVLVLIAYSNTFTASFHFDDDAQIAENPAIKRVSGQNVVSLLKTQRPVTNLSLMFNYAISGMNVVSWHIFNIGVHMANSIMVYVLILWTLTLPVFRNRYAERARGMALFGALLFALHPVQTESVTYIISRSELLASFFCLSTFLLFIKGSGKNSFRYYVPAFITSLLAMASKEWAATLPALLLLYDFLFLSESSTKLIARRWKAYILLFLPWILIAYILTLHKGSGSLGFGISGQKGITPWTYLLTSLNVIWTYIRLLFLPINQNLDYDYAVAKTLFEFPTLISFIGHVFVIGAAFWLYRKKGHLLLPFGVAWFYITLSPTQSIVPILDVIFEHRVYFPSIGFFFAFIYGYYAFFEWVGQRKQVRKGQALST